MDRDLALGHYKPINSPRFVNDCHEFIFHFSPSGRTPLDRLALGVPYQDQSNVTRWQAAQGGRRCRGNTWFLPYDTIQNRDKDRPHPATFPARLPDYCLRLHGLARLGVVADPFLGLGSTAVACALLGVDFVGIELDRGYLDEAIDASAAGRSAARHTGGSPARRAAHAQSRYLVAFGSGGGFSEYRLPRPDVEIRAVRLDLDLPRPLHAHPGCSSSTRARSSRCSRRRSA